MERTELLAVLRDLIASNGAELTKEGKLELPKPVPATLRETFAALGKTTESAALKKEAVDLLSGDFLIYKDETSFLSRLKLDDFDRDFGILGTRAGGPVLYRAADGAVVSPDGPVAGYHFLENARKYCEVGRFLEESKIATYHGTTAREYVVVTPENGVLFVGYRRPGEQQLASGDRMGGRFAELVDRSKSADFKAFVRAELYRVLNGVPREGRLEALLRSMPEIFEAAERNYEVYLTKFSFSKLKEDFRKQREEYFKGFRDTLKSLLTTAVAVPVSVAAAAFAVEKVKDNRTFVVLIVVVYIVYTLCSSYLVSLIEQDLSQTRRDLESDLAAFRRELTLNRQALEEESQRILGRISKLSATTVFLRLEIIGMALVLPVIALILLKSPFEAVAFACLLITYAHVMLWVDLGSR